MLQLSAAAEVSLLCARLNLHRKKAFLTEIIFDTIISNNEEEDLPSDLLSSLLQIQAGHMNKGWPTLRKHVLMKTLENFSLIKGCYCCCLFLI